MMLSIFSQPDITQKNKVVHNETVRVRNLHHGHKDQSIIDMLYRTENFLR